MPRPAAKRNRLAKVLIPTKEKARPHDASESHARHLENVSSKLPGGKKRASRYAGDTEHQAKDQTPTTRRRDHTIVPTPAGQRVASGSRPSTRARGYSSTLSLDGRKGDTNSKVPGTPAFEKSLLSNFKRRPRQPSILQMVHAGDGGSDPDDDDFLGGLSPDDESTPLNLARQKSIQARQDATSQPESLSPPSTDGSRKRKRTPEEFQVPGSPSDIVENTQLESSPLDNREGGRFASVSSPPLPNHVGALSQTMALPESSSPVLSPAHAAFGLGPSHIAPEAAEHAKEAYRGAIPLSTETLQGKVLPRRRLRHRKNRNASDFEVPSDDDDYAEADDDELSRMPVKASKSQQKQVHRTKPLAESGHRSKSAFQKQNKNRATATARDPTAKGPDHPRARRTFGKENRVDNIPSETASEPAARGRFTSEELENQARKFAEIDKWKMEFEDIAISGSQASSTA